MSPYETETETYKRKDGRWSLKLNVLEPGEVKQGYAGEKITMVFRKSSDLSSLYNYDQMVALLDKSVCSILTDSHWYGRLRCKSDEFDKRYMITIDNVTQRDAGLYKVGTGKDESGRCFLNITDRPTYAVFGDNITIGWFYNQQGMKRTLLVIHPNQEVMMLLPQTNVPQFRSNFQHRLLYSGDASERFMLFTLLNVGQSDAGLYTIETLLGNTIPGSKQLIVEEENTINVQTNGTSTLESVSVPIYLIPAMIGAVGVINLIICCIIWIRRKNTSRMEPDRRHAQEECDTDLYLTPIGVERPLPMPLMEDGRGDNSNTAQIAQFDNSMRLLHKTQSLCMDAYEMVDISSNDDPKSTLNNEETICKETICESTETINSGCLTVLGVLDASV